MAIHNLMLCALILVPFALISSALADDPPPPGTLPPVPTPASAAAAATQQQSAQTVLPAPPSASASAPATVGVLTPKLQPQSVTVALISGATMTGTLAETDQWTMKTSLGTTSLPLSAVAGVRMAQEGNPTSTVILHNGDTLTGAVQLDHITIQTDWGRAEIFGTHVASVLFTPGLKWTSEPGLNGTRWKLVADESRSVVTHSTTGSTTGTATSSNTTTNSASTTGATTASTQPRVVTPARPPIRQ
jgi:hypothetical protein